MAQRNGRINLFPLSLLLVSSTSFESASFYTFRYILFGVGCVQFCQIFLAYNTAEKFEDLKEASGWVHSTSDSDIVAGTTWK